MINRLLRLVLIAASIIMLTACLTPKTPQDVTQAFWDAVINNDTADIAAHSTLTDLRHYDGFSKDWIGYQPSWGKVVIEGDEASIASKFSAPANSGKEDRKFTTYLVHRNNEWKVDYDRTNYEVQGGAFGSLFGTLSKLGNDLTRQLQYSAKDFNAEMDRLSRDIEAHARQFEQQATVSIELYAAELRKRIDELVESINRALKERKGRLSDEDMRILTQVSGDLAQDSEHLSDPTLESIVTSSKSVGMAQLKLESIGDDSIDQYRNEWRDLGEQFEAELREMLARISEKSTGAATKI